MPLRPAVRRLFATILRTGAVAVAGLALTALAAGPTADPAWAAKKKTATTKASPAADSRYAAIVVDSATGEVLFAKNADARRYPASLTKIMTLYILFEEMQKGRYNEASKLSVSAKAAAQAPSKLGLKAGGTITVGEAIRGLVTKSANDAAMVVAENVSGSEEAFGKRMTATARRLGMHGTTFRNPNGLPNPGQVTTARDMATLGLAVQTRFPQEYKYFSTRKFVFRGATYGNHNRLLGSVEGVDGIKTGYIRASGFNLVTSVKRDGRQLVAVVMGGATGRSRDAHMAELVRTYLPKATRTRATQPLVASVRGGWKLPQTEAEVAAADPTAEAPMVLAPAASASPARPVVVALRLPVSAPARPAVPVAVAAVVEEPVAPLAFAALPVPAPVAAAAPVAPAPQAAPIQLGSPSNADVAAAKAQLTAMLQQFEEEQGDTNTVDGAEEAVVVASTAPIAVPEIATPQPVAVAAPAPTARDGWKIQIGALPSQTAASERLAAARDQFARLLAQAEPYTEPVAAGSTTLYRARFAGFETQAAARAACAQIKKRAYDCLPVLQ
ncbi:D-alanyl-D-alanine carboxypeptidase [Pseudoxanthobacter sp. M-2]|uniref:D-alanyl-D-alanine carboxypeptidase n=1 Tax=Pseudoxanthobacter sp. M-2 TaxID=3078754 RepID=UPI0038FCE234